LGTITGDGRHSTLYQSGASATIALYKGGQLLVGGIGDTRAILGGPQKSSKIRVMTSTHSPAEPKEKQRIEQSGGQVRVITKEGPESTRFPEIVQRESIFPASARVCVAGEWSPGLAVSRAFGDYYAKKLGVSVLPEFKAAVTGGWKRPQNTTGQVLIIASDGVWDVMDNQEARTDYQKSSM
jgi:serine/threonine protein phosphatase PrpC